MYMVLIDIGIIALGIYSIASSGVKWYNIVTILAGIAFAVFMIREYYEDQNRARETQELKNSNQEQFDELFNRIKNNNELTNNEKDKIVKKCKEIQNQINTYVSHEKMSPKIALERAEEFYTQQIKEIKQFNEKQSQYLYYSQNSTPKRTYSNNIKYSKENSNYKEDDYDPNEWKDDYVPEEDYDDYGSYHNCAADHWYDYGDADDDEAMYHVFNGDYDYDTRSHDDDY